MHLQLSFMFSSLQQTKTDLRLSLGCSVQLTTILVLGHNLGYFGWGKYIYITMQFALNISTWFYIVAQKLFCYYSNAETPVNTYEHSTCLHKINVL